MPASHYYKTDNAIYKPEFTNSKAIRIHMRGNDFNSCQQNTINQL